MNDLEFKLANKEDINEIVELYQRLIGTPGCTWNNDYPDKEMAEYDIENNWLYTLRKQNKIIAVASICKFDELVDLPWKPKNPCELARVGVDLSLHRQGIGTMLLEKVIEVVKEKGFDGIIMLVSKNNIAALKLYEKFGFEKCGEVFRYDNDYYCYQKVL